MVENRDRVGYASTIFSYFFYISPPPPLDSYTSTTWKMLIGHPAPVKLNNGIEIIFTLFHLKVTELLPRSPNESDLMQRRTAVGLAFHKPPDDQWCIFGLGFYHQPRC